MIQDTQRQNVPEWVNAVSIEINGRYVKLTQDFLDQHGTITAVIDNTGDYPGLSENAAIILKHLPSVYSVSMKYPNSHAVLQGLRWSQDGADRLVEKIKSDFPAKPGDAVPEVIVEAWRVE
jgi:hypothetical protein